MYCKVISPGASLVDTTLAAAAACGPEDALLIGRSSVGRERVRGLKVFLIDKDSRWGSVTVTRDLRTVSACFVNSATSSGLPARLAMPAIVVSACNCASGCLASANNL